MERQRTIKTAALLEGVGLQTGKRVKVKLAPSPADSGVNFIRVDLANKPLLNIRSLKLEPKKFWGLERRTVLASGALQVQTTEHLLAALSGLSIDNIVIELDSDELPGLDGSAKDFVDAIRSCGMAEQAAPRRLLKVEKKIYCEIEDSSLSVIPDEAFRISYTISYKDPSLGTQVLSLEVDEKSFESQIAPARTFCLASEARSLLDRGLGKGANYENTLVIGKEGPLNNTYRFPDEPVRHKILDLIGDLYLLGFPIAGHVIAVKSGHRLNMELVKKIKKLMKI